METATTQTSELLPCPECGADGAKLKPWSETLETVECRNGCLFLCAPKGKAAKDWNHLSKTLRK